MPDFNVTTGELVTLLSATYATQNQQIPAPTPGFQAYLGLAANDISVRSYETLDFDLNISAISGASASLTVLIERKGDDGVYYTVYAPAALTATGKTSTSIGKGAVTNVEFGEIIRVTFSVSNTVTPSVTFSASLIGKS